MGTSIDILFFDSSTLGQPGTLEQIIQIFHDLDFRLDNFAVVDDAAMFTQDRARLKSFSIQEIIVEALQSKSLSFDASHPGRPVELLQQIGWREHSGLGTAVPFLGEFLWPQLCTETGA